MTAAPMLLATHMCWVGPMLYQKAIFVKNLHHTRQLQQLRTPTDDSLLSSGSSFLTMQPARLLVVATLSLVAGASSSDIPSGTSSCCMPAAAARYVAWRKPSVYDARGQHDALATYRSRCSQAALICV